MLEFDIVDIYQADNWCFMNIFFGGESFLVSFVLAFGFSELAGWDMQI